SAGGGWGSAAAGTGMTQENPAVEPATWLTSSPVYSATMSCGPVEASSWTANPTVVAVSLATPPQPDGNGRSQTTVPSLVETRTLSRGPMGTRVPCSVDRVRTQCTRLLGAGLA